MGRVQIFTKRMKDGGEKRRKKKKGAFQPQSRYHNPSTPSSQHTGTWLTSPVHSPSPTTTSGVSGWFGCGQAGLTVWPGRLTAQSMCGAGQTTGSWDLQRRRRKTQAQTQRGMRSTVNAAGGREREREGEGEGEGEGDGDV